METQRSPNPAGSGERLPGTGWSFLSFDPLPQRLAAGDTFHGELARTRDALRGASPLHRPVERDRKEERAEPERRDTRAETRSEHAQRTERPARRAAQAEQRADAERTRRDPRAPAAARVDDVECLPREPEFAREFEASRNPRAAGDAPSSAARDQAEPVETRPIGPTELRAAATPSAQRPHERRAGSDGEAIQPTGAAVARPELDAPRRRAAAAGARPGAERAEQRRAEEVLRQFRNLLHPTLRNATLQLEPHELGKLTIRIAMHEGQLEANVRAERAETLELLKKHLPELRAALASAGIQTRSLDLELGAQERGDQPGGAPRRAGAARSEGDASFDAHLERARPIAPRGAPELDTWA